MHGRRICIVGLGYVGLPLAIEFGKQAPIVGFDINKEKLAELNKGYDSMKEVDNEELKKADIFFTSDPENIKKGDFIIIAVPTPVNDDHTPDLTPVIKASETVGKQLKPGDIVVYESTVYPGATEEVCLPILERESNLKLGAFTIGYSPERVNPGDKKHTIEKIVKVVSGSDDKTAKIVKDVYTSVITAGVHMAPTIKTAEAAKVIENTQRDLNIALMNELSLIFEKMGIKTMDVLDAAATKWNFQKFTPGLVGGHCIGVDPYYLTYKAQQLGYHPQVILAGRDINDGMAEHVSKRILSSIEALGKSPESCTALMLGVTFKENINDTRNSKVKDLIKFLKKAGVKVHAYDPMLTDRQLEPFGAEKFFPDQKFDVIVMATAHSVFKEEMTPENLLDLMKDPKYLFDIRNFYNPEKVKELGIRLECL